ncbi:MAG TPA: hypothetical protein VLA20_03970 [Vicinamibacterales bacterium]|nr:hypothetical protein [Vicinamibacterales bacterium]
MALIVATVVVAVWYLVWDMFLLEPLLGSYMAGIPGMNPSPALMWIVVGELSSGLVLAAVYARVRSVFGTGLANGATYGVYAAVLANFPLWLMMSVYAGWPYGTAWAFTIASIPVWAIAGGLVGLVYQKMGTPARAA